LKKKTKYWSCFILLVCSIIYTSPNTFGQIILVNKANPIDKISKSMLRNIFLGNNISWENGRRIQIVDFVLSSPLRKIFNETTLLLSPQKVSMIWIKVSLSGKSLPPKIVHSEEDVKNFVNDNEGAIGYIKSPTTLPQSAKIIQIIDE